MNNWYNVFIRTETESSYLLALTREKVEEIITKLNSGHKSLTVTGRHVNFNNITRFLIFVITKRDILSDSPGLIRKHIRRISRSHLRLKRLNTSVFNFIGHEVTDEFQIRDFGHNTLGIYVNTDRILEIKNIHNPDFDLSVLIKKCEELNITFKNAAYYSVAILVRSIIDHVPPIFEKRNFGEVSSNYGTKSFKASMTQLDNSSRKIADSFLHNPIRKKEVLPSETQVDFSRELDVLLGEIVRILKK